MSVTIATRSAVISTSPSPTARNVSLAVLVHDELAGHDLGDQLHVLRVDADLALERRQRDHVHVVGEERWPAGSRFPV